MGKVDRTLGREIRRRRIAGGDTLESLSGICGVSEKTIGKWERSDRLRRRLLRCDGADLHAPGEARRVSWMSRENMEARGGGGSRQMPRTLLQGAAGLAVRCVGFRTRSCGGGRTEVEADGSVDAERHLQRPTRDTLPIQAD